MKFNVQRVLTPAYLTSIALVVVGVVLGLAWYPVAAWLFVLSGLALNAVAVSITAIDDAPRGPGTTGRRGSFLPSRGGRDEVSGDDFEDEQDELDEQDDDLADDRDRDLADRSAGGVGAAPRTGSRRPGRGASVEPEIDTAATPTVPHSGSSALRDPR